MCYAWRAFELPVRGSSMSGAMRPRKREVS